MSSGDIPAGVWPAFLPPVLARVWMTSLDGASAATLSGRRLAVGAVGREPAVRVADLVILGAGVFGSLALAMIAFLHLAYASTSVPRLAKLRGRFYRGRCR